MSTVATPEVRQLAKDWEAKCGLSSAVISGIVGDLAHKARGGYHISRTDQPSTNYSVTRPDDKAGPSDAAAAIDMTMSTADMKTCTIRLEKAYSNATDPRRKYLNAFNGWTGTGDAKRYDVVARKIVWATADHKWHVHMEIRRRYVNSMVAMKAILSILKGESVAAYLSSVGVAPAVTKPSAAVAVPAFPGRVLKRNDAQKAPDAALKVWQNRMIARGWSSLGKSGDGFFGAGTESVVKRFQASCGVAADGMIGPTTWKLPWVHKLGG